MERLKEINENMSRAFEEKGVRIKKAYYCPHQTSDNCECRKPKGGLFRMAEKELGSGQRGPSL
jgi:D-glycero-D-manno-heptose 1,7-bisphosphate phosphatase